MRNVKGAFALHPSATGRIEGRRVVLIDDVITTGATVSTCAEALLRAGVANVDVLTLRGLCAPMKSDGGAPRLLFRGWERNLVILRQAKPLRRRPNFSKRFARDDGVRQSVAGDPLVNQPIIFAAA